MSIQFGATTYKSLAAAFKKATLQGDANFTKTLKGHCEDFRTLQAFLELSPENPAADRIVITNRPKNEKASTTGEWYYESIPLKDKNGKIRADLREKFRQAFSKSKGNHPVPLNDLSQYIQKSFEKIETAVQEQFKDNTNNRPLDNPLNPTIQENTLEQSKINQFVTTFTQTLEFFYKEASRIQTAFSKGKITPKEFEQYRFQLFKEETLTLDKLLGKLNKGLSGETN